MKNRIVEWDLDAAQWAIREEGQEAPVALLDTQEEAIGYARGLRAQEGGGGQIKVRQLDGKWSDASE